MLAAPLVACMTAVAAANGLPPLVLPAIHMVEGGQVGTIAKNANGSEDYGVMQINSSWLPTLAQGLDRSASQVRSDLIHDGCFNIAIAGAVMKYKVAQAGGDIWQAVGYYSSHTASFNAIYQARVAIAAVKIQTGHVTEREK
ncbi:MAG: hypothetical protein QOJ54_1888 [Aliidongia sp.]|nr:hypothetical protein [Aliidongia sp.]